MDQDTLVKEQIDAGAEYVTKLDQVLPLTAAFWLKTTLDGRWYLYVAPEQMRTGTGVGLAARPVMQVARELQDPNINPLFTVKLVASDDPLTLAALDYLQLYGGTKPVRVDAPVFGDRAIEGAYLYPLLAAAQGKPA